MRAAEFPAEPIPPPGDMSARPVPAGNLVLTQDPQAIAGAEQQHPQHLDLFGRSPQGLRLAFVLSESGDEVWYAICDAHGWLSLGGSRPAVEDAICGCCEQAREATARRERFVREHGWFVFDALMASRG